MEDDVKDGAVGHVQVAQDGGEAVGQAGSEGQQLTLVALAAVHRLHPPSWGGQVSTTLASPTLQHQGEALAAQSGSTLQELQMPQSHLREDAELVERLHQP